MSLEDLKRKLEDMRRGRAGTHTSLEFAIYKQTRCPMSRIYVPDPLMDLPVLEDVRIFLKLDKTNELPFVVDKWDCDNYAALLRTKAMLYSKSIKKNWAFGECESDKYGGHRFNIVTVKPNAFAYFIEPQTDRFFTKTGKFNFILF